CWGEYNGIEDELNVKHKTVNHSKWFTDPKTGVNTNTIEGVWNDIKLQVAPHNRCKDVIKNHLFEYIWHKKYKNNLWNAFIDALCTTGYPNN
ncbi:16307_t:CDS:1, partial [Gigaspora margarita]